MDEDAGGVPHPSHIPSNSFISGNGMLPGMQGMGGGMPGMGGMGSGLAGMGGGIGNMGGMGNGMPGLGSGMSGLGGGMPGMGGGMPNMNGMSMGGMSSDMERRGEDGTDFSHFGDDSNKGNELGLDSEPQGGPKPRKHFRGFQRKPEANLLLLKAVLKHQPFKHGNVGPGWAAVTAEINAHVELFAGEETACTVDTCRNTYERLVESWFKQDRREASFCGPEYDYTEWNELLDQIDPKFTRKTPSKSSGGGAWKRGRSSFHIEPERIGLCSGPGKPDANVIDMRSDTVTRPTPEMRKAMADAVVGDDVFGDDPTVRELECQVAHLFEKQAALFVPSGTMANLIAVMVHCDRRGSEMITGHNNHIIIYEQGSVSQVAGVFARQLRTVMTAGERGPETPVGGISVQDIEEALRPDDVHFPSSRLVCLENTHNLCGGCALPAEYVDSVAMLCRVRNLKLHIDGARIFNAAVALGTSVGRLCRGADSVAVCLSKGLSAPVGSLIVGSDDFIRRARRCRKVLGGGMRQAGVLAAAGLLSVNVMSKRLVEDHENAFKFAKALSELRGVEVDLDSVQTNIVLFRLPGGNAHKAVMLLRSRHVFMGARDDRTIRACTHQMITSDHVDRAVDALKRVLVEIGV